MTLSFTQTINGKPNYFIEKIWWGLTHHFPFKETDWFIDYEELYRKKFGTEWPCTPCGTYPNEKIHTIRLDPHNRWRAGMDIHPVINNRTPQRFQFAPTIPCKNVQRIEMNQRFGKSSFEVVIDGKIFAQKHYGYDKDKNPKGLLKLALNDGFDDVDSFIEYFEPYIPAGGSIEMKLIHWTDLKY